MKNEKCKIMEGNRSFYKNNFVIPACIPDRGLQGHVWQESSLVHCGFPLKSAAGMTLKSGEGNRERIKVRGTGLL